MDNQTLDERINTRGKKFLTSIGDEAPTVFNKNYWTGKVMDWCMTNEQFKIQMFRFVDVLPYLTTSSSLTRHIQEYFTTDSDDLPAILKWGAKGAGIGGALTGAIIGRTIRANIERMARQFIIGENAKEAIKSIKKLREDGFAFTLDILGEATVSEAEADSYANQYLMLLDALAEAAPGWKDIDGGDTGLDWGYSPRINISVKSSALFSQTHPKDFEGSVAGILTRFTPIYRRVIELGGYMCVDMEHHQLKDITLEVYRRLRSDPEFRHYPGLRIAMQSYLRDTDTDLAALLDWARRENLPISIRLVKGAYWDYETLVARQHGWPIPVYTVKAESDAAFERHTRLILEHHDICTYACGSHNIRSISATMELAAELGVPEECYEFQVLYGMAEPVRKGLLNVAKRVRLYAPYGDLIPGMAYLVRRLLENTANESFLRQTFVEDAQIDTLLENPVMTVARQLDVSSPVAEPENIDHFTNDPLADFSRQSVRDSFVDALATVRTRLGRTYPLHIGETEVATNDFYESHNPAAPNEVIGRICQAGPKQIDHAIEIAGDALKQWRALTATERADYLLKTAAIARKRHFELASWQVLEVGKQWDQASADVNEAVDFLEYYAREMIRLSIPRRMGRAPGEENYLYYQPRGIAAVIAPWNFPLAIACGMSAAAIVTGNPVLFKPAGPASVIGYTLFELFQEAGLPPGVFNYVPGRGEVMGDYLIEHPGISLIAFTGSLETGQRILKKASTVQPGQAQVKRVITEMGGKNAIIIDDDADLDQAVGQVISSAFGFQGQKCSACSRVIVLESIYERFVTRLVEAGRSLAIGPAENPAHFMGPVVDGAAYKNISAYVELAKQEGNLLLSRDVPDTGYYVPLTIVEAITPAHRIAQEEIFGPVLAVMKVKDFDQAIEWANQSRFGLTGAVFSRSPAQLEKARHHFNVGNLYLNKGSTGALVERHPFGGFKMSGIGSKTGGPDYLIQFLDPRVVSENTMRRGFAPIREDDDYLS
jgi:RHH-type proline utilization regulon transcriptional repressor/proline dehydrogenase/delta 1-pyrroline-5-carboxylate dehydrogenase